jgi:hypothetical protein
MLLIRTMDPSDGRVQDTYEYMNLPGFDPTVQQITNVTYNNYGGFTMSLKNGSNYLALCKHTMNTSTITSVTPVDLGGFNANLGRFITCQTPKEEFGGFYVFPYRENLGGAITNGSIDYVQITPSNIIGSPNPNYKYTALTGDQGLTSSCQIGVFNLSTTSNLTVFKQPIVSRQPYKDYIYMLSDYDQKHFYEITSFSTSNQTQFTSNTSITESRYEFSTNTSNLTPGAQYTLWKSQ